jgi:hypothetical protein
MSITPGPNDSGPKRFAQYTGSPQSGPTPQPMRDRRTRRTVDLPLATHRALDGWQREAADRLGVARVTGQEVLTALIDQLLTDPKLSGQIIRAIQARK